MTLCLLRYYVEHYENDGGSGNNASGEIAIAHTSIGAATSWAQLDNAVRRAFKQHVARLDPGGGLGLGKFDNTELYKNLQFDYIILMNCFVHDIF